MTAQVAATHASSLENLEISSPLLTILEDVLLKFIVACRVSISTIKLAFLLLVFEVSLRSIPRLKRRQEKYRVALRVQCVTLLDAGILLDVICSWWLVTKSVVH